MLTRRSWLIGSAALVASSTAYAAPALRIGLQRSGMLLVLLRQRGALAKRFPKHELSWAEFPAGPQVLEALAVGSVDLGVAGDAPPVFAQAAGKEFLYVAAEAPRPRGSVILVKPESPIRKVEQLRGRKVALQKGSSAHYLLARALLKARLRWSDISPAYLTPADARAAFEGGDVDAWAIWDPYFAAAEAALPTRVLTDGVGLCTNPSFYLASPALARQPALVTQLIAALNEANDFVQANREQAARLYAEQSGLELGTVLRVLDRRNKAPVQPLDAALIADQQRVADTFFELGLIPDKLRIADRVVT